MEKFVVNIDRHEELTLLVEANDEEEAEDIVNKKAREGALEHLHADIVYGEAGVWSEINGTIEKEEK